VAQQDRDPKDFDASADLIARLIGEPRGNQGDLVFLTEFLGQLLVEHPAATPEWRILIIEH
jgi:hypothetical protein